MTIEAVVRVILSPLGRRPGMRSTLLLSVFSLVFLSLFGWIRHESRGDAPTAQEAVDDEGHLFV